MNRIITDEKMYQQYFDSLRIVTLDHEYDNAYKIFMKEIEDKMEI